MIRGNTGSLRCCVACSTGLWNHRRLNGGSLQVTKISLSADERQRQVLQRLLRQLSRIIDTAA